MTNPDLLKGEIITLLLEYEHGLMASSVLEQKRKLRMDITNRLIDLHYREANNEN